jgi:hypothetical protein
MLVFYTHLNKLKTITLADEMYAISSNSIDQIALGGEKKQVGIYSLEDVMSSEENLSDN